MGIDVEPFYLDADDIDPQNGQTSLFDFKFGVSYGDPQEVRVLAKRSLGEVTLSYRINGGTEQSAQTSEWDGGERYGVGNDTYYHVVSGKVTGTDAGCSVEVWFEGTGKESDSFTYDGRLRHRQGVLILAAEDYTGASPVQPPGGGPLLPVVLRGRLGGERQSSSTSTTSTPTAAPRRTPSACSATTTRSSGTPATTS